MTNTLTIAGEQLIKSFESCQLNAYQDCVGVWTMAWGHTHNVHQGDSCTDDQAQQLFTSDVLAAAQMINYFIHVPLNDNQFSALVSLVFNEGSAPLQKTLGSKINLGDFTGAAAEFPKWCYAGGRILGGLQRRRAAEQALFLTPCQPETSDV